jgi:hypothetical protein
VLYHTSALVNVELEVGGESLKVGFHVWMEGAGGAEGGPQSVKIAIYRLQLVRDPLID